MELEPGMHMLKPAPIFGERLQQLSRWDNSIAAHAKALLKGAAAREKREAVEEDEEAEADDSDRAQKRRK